MAQILGVSIDVTKLTKSRFITGKKGTYANIQIALNDEKDQFGNDCSVWESQSKEERDAKTPKNFLGNGKIIWSSEANNAPSQCNVQTSTNNAPFQSGFEIVDISLPF